MDNMSGLWRRTTLMQRVILLGVALAVVGAGALLVREDGTPYEVKEGGTSIFVPVDKVAAMRLAMASAGMPAGDKGGYRILDDEKIGASPFAQRVNYIRAIEGELAKTVGMIDGVVSARVHIVKPEASLFADKQKEGTATVVLRSKPGWRPTNGNISAIVHMVAGSVEGLSSQKVVVVDSSGTLLSGENKGETSLKADTFLDMKARVEQYLARKAEDMLAVALGPNRATVRVTAEIDGTGSKSTTETYDPNKRVAIREEVKSSTSGAGGAAGGAGKEENSSMEYKVSVTTEQREELPGKIKNLSVAAFVSLNKADKDGKNAGPIIPEKDVEDIIRKAVGLTEKDTLKVVNTAFYEAPVAEGKEESQGFMSTDFLLEMARRFSLGILVIGGLIVLRLFRGSKKGVALSAAGAAQPALEGGGPVNLLTGEADPEALRAQITHALMEKPEEVKRLFVNWAKSDEERV
ncbi:MAG: flagellar basal-body MS-ring/collar protein FliF [Planctomycetota bacterium]|nr:flagellar basal-body MS-ring/collar protein FliF [Planctomycetota bacterium]